MEPFVSLVVPTFNRRASLARLLHALEQQVYPATHFEVVVVDDGSSDGTVSMLRSLALPYTIRTVEQAHEGPAAARNRGVEAARGPLIVFLDDDVIPLPELLAAHVATHQGEQDLVVIGRMSPPPASWRRPPWVRWEDAMRERQYRAQLAGAYSCTARQFYTGNASLSRTLFLAVGGFDTRFQRAEDVELGFRLRDRGARFIFDPAANVLHYASRSFASWCRAAYQYGRYDVLMYRESGRETLACALAEFHQRHLVSRMLTRLCVGRRTLVAGAGLALRGAVYAGEHLGAWRPAALALSGLFSLLYWQGVCDELGVPEQVRRALAARAPQRPPACELS